MTPATAPSKGQQSSQLCRGQFKRDSWRGPFTDLSTLSMDQWVLEIRLLHTLVAPTRSRPGISHLISPQHRAYPAQVEGGCPRAALLCPPTPPRSPATHVVIPEQNLLPQVVPLQSPRELQSSELTSQKLGVDKGLGVGRPCSDQAPPGGLWPPPARGTYQLLDPLPLCLWGELRTQGLDLIPPYQDGPTKGQEERERSVEQPPPSPRASLLLPPLPAPRSQFCLCQFLAQSPPRLLMAGRITTLGLAPAVHPLLSTWQVHNSASQSSIAVPPLQPPFTVPTVHPPPGLTHLLSPALATYSFPCKDTATRAVQPPTWPEASSSRPITSSWGKPRLL